MEGREGEESVFKPPSVLNYPWCVLSPSFLSFHCFLSLFGFSSLSLSLCFSVLIGSQRISDSEFSDYDCEDGIGVISGKMNA